MAKGTISMKRFKANLTKISRLAKSGYNSITSVAKQIISTVTQIASKIAVVSPNAEWKGASGSLPVESFESYYDDVLRAEQRFLNSSLTNLMNYKDEIIHDIFTVGDALSHNADQVSFGLAEILREEFGELSGEFISYGRISGTGFGSGLKESIGRYMGEVEKMVVSAMQRINSLVSSSNQAVTSNVTYSNPSYNFFSSKQTVTEQLNEARKAQAISAMRRP